VRRLRPGVIHDNSLRLLTPRDLAAACDWLGIRAGSVVVPRFDLLPGSEEDAEVVAWIGPARLAHIAYLRTPHPDLPYRMLEYRARILRRAPDHSLDQHVVVLDRGTAVNEVTDGWMYARFQVTYLRREDPARLLANPALAPLAVLAGEDDAERPGVLRQALETIRALPDRTDRLILSRRAATLAGIHLDTETITTLTQEAGMPLILDEDTVAGRIIAEHHFVRGEARGLARGRVRERVVTLTILLERTFGDDPRIADAAHSLARLPREEALDIALTATTLESLLE
jgi:hypothetical protein